MKPTPDQRPTILGDPMAQIISGICISQSWRTTHLASSNFRFFKTRSKSTAHDIPRSNGCDQYHELRLHDVYGLLDAVLPIRDSVNIFYWLLHVLPRWMTRIAMAHGSSDIWLLPSLYLQASDQWLRSNPLLCVLFLSGLWSDRPDHSQCSI